MKCSICGESKTVSRALGICGRCIRSGDMEVMERARAVHEKLRTALGDVPVVPRSRGCSACCVCVNSCRPAEGERGYCSIRSRKQGEVGMHDGPSLSWYYDPLPTNCVAQFVCPGGTGAGYPEFAVCSGPERGMKNLAVFYHSCSFDCLFCQNWHFREARGQRGSNISPADLADAVDDTTTCICYFGGDPGTQVEHAIEASREARSRNRAGGRPLRICWETNGSVAADRFEEMIELSRESGGCVKVDLKAFDEQLHKALTNCSNRRTLENFELLARRSLERPDPPLAVASTLMVPGYVDAQEVGRIARFIAGFSRDIPYSLLAFHGDFAMADLPRTSRKQAEECLAAAKDAGLKRVHIGNSHLL